MKLYPRLHKQEATAWARELARLDGTAFNARVAEIRGTFRVVGGQLFGPFHFSPTGGQRVTGPEVEALRVAIIETATKFGYQAARPAEPVRRTKLRELRADFDVALSATLAVGMDTSPAEARDATMWAWLGCVVAPEVVRWRWPESDVDANRYGPKTERNLFGRCWWRGHILHTPGADDPWWLLRRLNEDEIVQLTERPRLARNHGLARAIADRFLVALDAGVQVTREKLWRETMKRLMRLEGLIDFGALSDDELGPILQSIIDETVAAVGPTPTTRRRPRIVREEEPLEVETPGPGAGPAGSPEDQLVLPISGVRTGGPVNRRDSVDLLAPAGLLSGVLVALSVRTIGDLVRVDEAALNSITGVGKVRKAEFLNLQAQAARRLALAKYLSLPVRAAAKDLKAARQIWRGNVRAGASGAERLRALGAALGDAGHALGPDPARRGRPTALQLRIGSPDGPLVDVWETFCDVIKSEAELTSAMSTRARRIASVAYADAWNAKADRPPLVVIDTRTGDEVDLEPEDVASDESRLREVATPIVRDEIGAGQFSGHDLDAAVELVATGVRMKVEDQDGINATLSAAQRRLVRGSFGEYAHFLAVVAHVRLALAGTER